MAYRKLGVKSAHRRSMLRNMSTSFFKHGSIKTTEARAKELTPMVGKMISLGKKGDLSARRKALAYLMEEDVVNTLFTEIAPRYKDRQGGYTRIIRLKTRQGDGAKIVKVELV